MDSIDCRKGHQRVLGGFGGVTGVFGGPMRVQGGPTLPLKDTFCPSGGLVPHQIWFLTPHNGPTGQDFPRRHP